MEHPEGGGTPGNDPVVDPEPLDPTGGADPTPGNADPTDPPADPATVEPTGDDPAADPSDKKGGVQKKIDKLTRKAADSDREAAYWKGVAEGGGTKKETAPTETTTQTGGLKPEDFSTYEDFVRAVADQAASSAREEVRQEYAETAQQDRLKTIQGQYEDARKGHEDFDEVALNPSLPFNQSMMDAAQGENFAEILYVLGKNTTKASQIASLPPLQAAREIGKIEAQITTPIKKPVKKKSNAPDPPTILGGTNADTVSEDKMSKKQRFAKWDESRRKRLGA